MAARMQQRLHWTPELQRWVDSQDWISAEQYWTRAPQDWPSESQDSGPEPQSPADEPRPVAKDMGQKVVLPAPNQSSQPQAQPQPPAYAQQQPQPALPPQAPQAPQPPQPPKKPPKPREAFRWHDRHPVISLLLFISLAPLCMVVTKGVYGQELSSTRSISATPHSGSCTPTTLLLPPSATITGYTHPSSIAGIAGAAQIYPEQSFIDEYILRITSEETFWNERIAPERRAQVGEKLGACVGTCELTEGCEGVFVFLDTRNSATAYWTCMTFSAPLNSRTLVSTPLSAYKFGTGLNRQCHRLSLPTISSSPTTTSITTPPPTPLPTCPPTDLILDGHSLPGYTAFDFGDGTSPFLPSRAFVSKYRLTETALGNSTTGEVAYRCAQVCESQGPGCLSTHSYALILRGSEWYCNTFSVSITEADVVDADMEFGSGTYGGTRALNRCLIEQGAVAIDRREPDIVDADMEFGNGAYGGKRH